MIPDPPVRKDGKCVVCHKPRPVVKPQRGVPSELYKIDPFCSTKCCRAWHLVALPPTGYRDPDEEAA